VPKTKRNAYPSERGFSFEPQTAADVTDHVADFRPPKMDLGRCVDLTGKTTAEGVAELEARLKLSE